MIYYAHLGLIELSSIRMIDAMCQVHQHNLQKRQCSIIIMHNGSIKHTGLVVETQAVVSNDASRPQGTFGSICRDKGLSIQQANHKTRND